MTRQPNETWPQFILRFLSQGERKPQQAGPERISERVPIQHAREVLGGEPQPVSVLLDNSEDIADRYSRPIHLLADAIPSSGAGNLQKGAPTTRKDAHPAPESTRPSTLLQVLGGRVCDTVEVTDSGLLFDCDAKAVSCCIHCGSPICLWCLKNASCWKNGQHELRMQ